ncbi:hypothetical protein ATCC90586_011343 [Pythium insidiosum]|nr:hypothetical protein ATCC90586_011343 [Pythium insidiosum]
MPNAVCAAAEHLDVVCVRGGAEAEAVSERHTGVGVPLEHAQQRRQRDDEEQRAQRAALEHALLSSHWRRGAVGRVRYDEERIVVERANAVDEARRRAHGVERAPHQLLRERAKRVAQVVPDRVERPVRPARLIDERRRDELVLRAAAAV